MTTRRYDVVIVGAGFAGLYALHTLRGRGLSVRLFEAAPSVGGTWYWNRYPGARVDVESVEYCYSFSPELDAKWRWSERYAAQPELLAYLNHVADRFDLRRDIGLETRVAAARFDEAANLWRIETDQGDIAEARFCVMATGCLSAPNDIPIAGAERFAGRSFRTSRWPTEEIDFTARRVGVIGTGSSGVQTITEIAPKVAELVVFQRTPSYCAPAHNKPMDQETIADWDANRKAYRELARTMRSGIIASEPRQGSAMEVDEDERLAEFERRWRKGGFAILAGFSDLLVNPAANETAAEFVRDKIRQIVADPVVAEQLTPRCYPIGAKRMCVDTGYYETFNRANVRLVDLTTDPIIAVEPAGIRTAAGLAPLDDIIYAVGFDALTGALVRIDIEGRGGVKLKDVWAAGPRTHLGLMTAGFPNLFIVAGPGGPAVLVNLIMCIEHNVGWIAEAIAWLDERRLATLEPTEDAQDAWTAHLGRLAQGTLFPLANSWYVGANIPGKPRVFMAYVGGLPAYRARCDEAAARGYEDFILESN
jgi:cation diffusion facilitator CzcD-associated flavoprotein CzcO